MGQHGNSDCVFCRKVLESRDHLFFECLLIWREVMRCYLLRNPYCYWDAVITWGLQNLKRNNVKTILCKLGWEEVMYHVWIQCNARIHAENLKAGKSIIQAINYM